MKSVECTVLLALIVLSACGPSANSNEAGSLSSSNFTERDSAGVVIAANSGSQARSVLGWEIDSTPDLSMGVTGLSSGESAPAWYTFHRIGGVRQLADGRVVVADGGSREVRFFDSSGEFIHRVGRQGRGPGEFEGGPILVRALFSDSLLLFDSKPVRFHFLSSDDDGYRIVRPATWKGATPPIGFIDPNVFVGLMYLHKPTTIGPYEIPATYAWVDIATGVRTLVDSFPVQPQYTTRFVDGLAYGGLIPFSPMPSAAVTRDGAFVTDGAHAEIKKYDIDGRLQRIIRVDEPSRQIENGDIQSYIEATGQPLDPDIPIPDVMPTFQSLLVDDEGWLWAKKYDWDPARRPVWVVFDPSGRAHGYVETPVGLRINQIASDFVLGVWTDELEVEHVRRYPLIRRSNAR